MQGKMKILEVWYLSQYSNPRFDSCLCNGKFGNGKGMKKIHSHNLGTGGEWKEHSHNSRMGREWKKTFPKFGSRKWMQFQTTNGGKEQFSYILAPCISWEYQMIPNVPQILKESFWSNPTWWIWEIQSLCNFPAVTIHQPIQSLQTLSRWERTKYFWLS